MARPRRYLSVTMLALLALSGTVQPARPCSCVGSSAPVAERLAIAGAVFSGVAIALVLKEEPFKDAQGHVTFSPSQRVKFRVSKVWRGVETDFVWVSSGMGWGECGYPFSLGRQYLVWADRAPDGSLSTWLCSGTGDTDIASQPANLGPPIKEFTHDVATEKVTCDK